MDRTSSGPDSGSRRRRRLIVALAVCGLALLAPVAANADLPPKHRLHWSNLTGIQYNPIGGANFLRFEYRYRLFDDDSKLFSRAFASVGTTLELSPVWFRGGLQLRLQPLAVLRFEAQVLGFKYFGILGSASTYPSASHDYDDVTRDSIGEDGHAIGGLSVRLAILLQAMHKNFAFRNRTRASFWHTDLGPGRTVFYSAGDDTVRPDNGWVIENVLETGYFLLDKQLLLGLRYRVVGAVHPDLEEDPNGPYHVLGPLVGWKFPEYPGAVFGRSALLFHAGWYMNHRYRVGPIPYLVMGFYFDGTLWSR